MHYGIFILSIISTLSAPQMELESAYSSFLHTTQSDAASQALDTPVNPKQGPFMAAQDMRIGMALGEQESVQVWVKTGKSSLENVRIQVVAPNEHAPEYAIYQISNILPIQNQRTGGVTDIFTVPDVLIPMQPAAIQADETTGYWITFQTTKNASPGRYLFTVELHADSIRTMTQRLVVEVKDFMLPDTSPIPVISHLHREALQRQYGLDARLPSDWSEHYASISKHSIVPAILDRSMMNSVRPDDITKLVDHLELLLAAGNPAMLEIGGLQGDLVDMLFREGENNSEHLANYLKALSDWRSTRLDHTPEFIMTMPVIPLHTTTWQSRYALYKYTYEQASQFNPIARGSIHPYFQPVIRHWAFPFIEYKAELAQRLQEGMSLRNVRQYPAHTFHASTPNNQDALELTNYTYAFDGSPFTFWDTGFRPTGQNPLMMTFLFDNLVHSERIKIIWGDDNHSDVIKVYTSADAKNFTQATINWSHPEARDEYENRVSEGKFRYANNFNAIRIELHDTKYDGNLKIALITFMGDELNMPDGLAPPIKTWLEINNNYFPSLTPGAHPIEPRLIPWVAWAHHYSGVLLPSMNYWPPDWPKLTHPDIVLEQVPGPWQHFLYYPGPTSLIPSIRLERLRDGLEDIAYITAVEDAVARGLLDAQRAQTVLGHISFPIHPDATTLSHLLSWIESRRSRAAELLHDIRYRSIEE